MKKIARKALQKKLHIAIEKVLKDNSAASKNKTEKAVVKSIKKIVKKTELKTIVAPKKKSTVEKK